MNKKLPRLYIVRHGETEWSKSGNHTGLTDIPLTQKGEKQARALKKYLKNKNFKKVYSSPLSRSVRTCELAGFKDDCEINNLLVEWNYGNYEGIKTKEIQKEHSDWSLFDHGCPSGETPEQVSERADSVIREIRAINDNVLIFSHGHFTRSITARWLGLDVSKGKHFVLLTATLSILGYDHNLKEPAILLWDDRDQMAYEL